MTFAEKLRELRDAAGLSEAKLAAASRVPFGSIHEYGLSRRRPSFDAVVKIARALGTTCEAFAECVDTEQGKPSARSSRKLKLEPPKRSRGRPRKVK